MITKESNPKTYVAPNGIQTKSTESFWDICVHVALQILVIKNNLLEDSPAKRIEKNMWGHSLIYMLSSSVGPL